MWAECYSRLVLFRILSTWSCLAHRLLLEWARPILTPEGHGYLRRTQNCLCNILACKQSWLAALCPQCSIGKEICEALFTYLLKKRMVICTNYSWKIAGNELSWLQCKHTSLERHHVYEEIFNQWLIHECGLYTQDSESFPAHSFVPWRRADWEVIW